MSGPGDGNNSAEESRSSDIDASSDHKKGSKQPDSSTVEPVSPVGNDSATGDSAGSDSAGSDSAGSDSAIPDSAGSDSAVSNTADEVMVVAEAEPVSQTATDSSATSMVDAASTPGESEEPMAIAEATPAVEPIVLTESDSPSASMATTDAQSATTPMVVAEPVGSASDAGGAATDGSSTDSTASSQPLVVASGAPDAESTVLSETTPNQEPSEPLVVPATQHAAEPMVVTAANAQPGQPAESPQAKSPIEVGQQAENSAGLESEVGSSPLSDSSAVADGTETTPTSSDTETTAGSALVAPADTSSDESTAEPGDSGVVVPGDAIASMQRVSSKAPGDPGKIVEGVVTGVSADGVELTLDDGRSAYISRRNFGLSGEAPDSVLSVGDRAHGAELSREDPKSRVVLSRSWALKKQAWDKIVEASKDGKPITGRVVSGSKKGVVVDVGVRGFVPMSHLELEPVADLTPYIEQTFELKVLEVDAQKEKLVLSRRSFLLKEQRKQMQEIISGITPGEVRTGKVSSFADYGAFIDLGGVNGLAHISELSWDRVGKPSDVLSLGQEVQVKVLDVKAKKKRISLSLRQITDDPLSGFEVGSILSGPVTRLVDFGAFVLVQGFEGLVHLSELAEYRVAAPEEIVTPGDVVGVKVLSVDKKRRRLELSIRRAAEYQG